MNFVVEIELILKLISHSQKFNEFDQISEIRST